VSRSTLLAHGLKKLGMAPVQVFGTVASTGMRRGEGEGPLIPGSPEAPAVRL